MVQEMDKESNTNQFNTVNTIQYKELDKTKALNWKKLIIGHKIYIQLTWLFSWLNFVVIIVITELFA